MPKAKRVLAPIGKGIDRATYQSQLAAGNSITVHEINENAWKAFYASPEGKARMRRLMDKNQLLSDRYQDIANGKGLQGITKADMIKKWKRTVFNDDGTVKTRV